VPESLRKHQPGYREINIIIRYLITLYHSSAGFVGMALSYGLSLNNSFVSSIQKQCDLANKIISVERVDQYMHIQSEAAEVIEENRPVPDWPQVGSVELKDLKVTKYTCMPD
jgi:hypothetical protein